MLTVLALTAALLAPSPAAPDWVAGWTWAPSSNVGPSGPASRPNPNDVRGPLGPEAVTNQTVSQTTTVSASGERLRLRVSNLYGGAPVVLGAVSVSINDAAPVAVTFDGAAGLTLPVGSPRLSDPVALPVRALDRVTVSVFYPARTALPVHRLRQVVREGDATGLPVPADALRQRVRGLVTAIEIEASAPTPVIVAMGDSITEGTGAVPSPLVRGWPERLSERMVAAGRPWAVVNAGIGGNRLLHQGSGPSGLERLDADALAVSGARCLVLLEGVNDIGRPARPEYAHEAVVAADLIAGYRQVIARGRAAGLNVVLTTIPPFEGANYFTDQGEATRQAVNAWLRSDGRNEADTVVDFDAAVRDPDQPSRFRTGLHSGDWLHPSDAGYQSMADAIPLDACD
ncbi:SGNH/GDSL hydrolase family protein [Brevundimonas sp. VNH65]|uniref:SGNH/GDSL hydrolase family protein n=1 Tax=Brevundimonas sp. VNH65 TaxID=3400917 RepID=UPI003C0E1EC5